MAGHALQDGVVLELQAGTPLGVHRHGCAISVVWCGGGDCRQGHHWGSADMGGRTPQDVWSRCPDIPLINSQTSLGCIKL
eukprot:8193416-Heterocapsa_arctica.AAC.1